MLSLEPSTISKAAIITVSTLFIEIDSIEFWSHFCPFDISIVKMNEIIAEQGRRNALLRAHLPQRIDLLGEPPIDFRFDQL